MAKARAATAGPRNRPAKGGQAKAGHGWLAGVACGVLLALAPAYAVLLSGTLLPGLAAWLISRNRPRRAALAMLLFGLAMSADRLRLLWTGEATIAAAWTLLSEPLTLTMAWFAAAFGWALAELLPIAVGAVMEFEAKRQSLTLRRARRRVAEGWNLERDVEGK